MIDFDLVEVEIERLWDNDNHDSGSSGSAGPFRSMTFSLSAC